MEANTPAKQDIPLITTPIQLSLAMKEYSAAAKKIHRSRYECVKDEIAYFCRLLEVFNLNINFEIVSDDGDTEEFNGPDTAQGDEPELPEGYPEDILSRPGTQLGRVIVSKLRNYSDFDKEFTFYANGLVLDTETWDILSMPSQCFVPQAKFKDVERDLQKFKLYKVRDGTTITFYYYQGKWIISSANGYEINDYKRIGNLTYMQAIEFIAENYPADISNKFAMDNLDKDFCYTIGFRHPDFHPFKLDKPCMWQISRSNPATGEYLQPDPSIGVNPQLPIDYSIIVDRDASYKSDAEYNREVMSRLFEICKKSIDILRSANVNVRKSRGTAENSLSINYGFILRGTFSECGRNCNTLIESSLFSSIRNNAYNVKGLAEVDLNDRFKHMAYNAFVNPGRKEEFIELFPQAGHIYSDIDSVVSDISARIIHKLRGRGNCVTTSTDRDKSMNLVAEKIVNIMKHDSSGINVYDKSAKKLARDIVMSPKHAVLIIKIINM